MHGLVCRPGYYVTLAATGIRTFGYLLRWPGFAGENLLFPARKL